MSVSRQTVRVSRAGKDGGWNIMGGRLHVRLSSRMSVRGVRELHEGDPWNLPKGVPESHSRSYGSSHSGQSVGHPEESIDIS